MLSKIKGCSFPWPSGRSQGHYSLKFENEPFCLPEPLEKLTTPAATFELKQEEESLDPTEKEALKRQRQRAREEAEISSGLVGASRQRNWLPKLFPRRQGPVGQREEGLGEVLLRGSSGTSP